MNTNWDESARLEKPPLTPTDLPLIGPEMDWYRPGPTVFLCPLCLQTTLQPVQQICGHVLCAHCTQQSLSMLGSCPLCRTQQFFDGGSVHLTNRALLMNQPMRSSSYDLMAPTQLQLQRAPQGMPESSVLVLPLTPETQPQSAPQSQSALAADTSDLVFQFDSLSDFSDMIDLAELVATESDNPSAATIPPPPVVAGAIRRRRRPTGVSTTDMLLQKPATAAVRRRTKSATATNIQAMTTAATPTSATGNRRKRKVSPHVDESMAWERIEAAGSPPAQRYDCGLAISGSLLIVVGGIVGKDRLNDLHVLDVDECPVQWRRPATRGSPPRPGSLLQTFVINETLYVIGGTKDGKFLTELHALDLSAEEWEWKRLEVAGTPPSMRYWYSLAVVDGMAILYGGYGHPQRLSDLFALRFDLDQPTWMEIDAKGDLPGPLSTHAVCVHDHKMFVFGGYDGKSRRGNLHALAFETKTKESITCNWTRIDPSGRGPSPRYTHATAVVGSKMIVYGGNSGCLKGDVHLLDLSQLSHANATPPAWTVLKCDDAPPPREWHRVVVRGEAMYVFGGHTSEGNDNAVYKLDAKCSRVVAARTT